MLKCIPFLLLLLTFSKSPAQRNGCPTGNQKGYSCGNIEETILTTLDRKNYNITSHFTVTMVNSFGSEADNKKAMEVVALCNRVLNDPDFWNALENYKKYRYAFFETDQGKQQIAGTEISNCLINGLPNNSNRPSEVPISLTVELYGLSFKTFFESAVAKEIGDGKIYNKKWFFRNETIDVIGSNWMHEFSHSKGLIHCFYCSEERDFSIPYVINRIFKEVAQKYMAKEQ